jgi:large subunit ribosomal protein L18
MTKMSARYRVPRRRRREGKTNYYKRYRMVLSGKTRLVVRKTNKYIEAKLVDFSPEGDKVIVSAHSIELVKKFGWKGSTSSTPASYLTGYLLGVRGLKEGIKEAILDIGLHRPVPGSKIFALAKGAIDAGLKIPVNESVFPASERIRGETIAKWAQELKENSPDAYERLFSGLIKRGFEPTGYPILFDKTLSRIKEGN